MPLPDAGQPEEYTKEEFDEVLATAEQDKSKLTKNQKAAVARYHFKRSQGQPVTFRTPGAAPAVPAPVLTPDLPPDVVDLMKKDPATLSKDEKIKIAKAKSQAAKAQMAAKAAGAQAPSQATTAKPKTADDVAREKALAVPLVQRLRAAFPDDVLDATMQTNVPQVIVRPEAIVKVLRAIRDEFGFAFLENLTAVDHPPERIDLVYNLANIGGRTHLSAKSHLPRSPPDGALPSIPTVTPLWKGADWLEREVYDMFGVRFEGHPDPRRLLLPEGWVGYPLRKDYDVTKEQFVATDVKGRDVVSFKEEEGW